MSDEWRLLEFGEVIREGDESDASADGWNDEPDWRPVRDGAIGGIAPDPRYPAHRRFRRRVSKPELRSEFWVKFQSDEGNRHWDHLRFTEEVEAAEFAANCIRDMPELGSFELCVEPAI